MPKLKKKLITARQKAARRMNIAVARKSKKKGKTRFNNALSEKKKVEVMVEKKKGSARKAINKAKSKKKR